MLDINPFSIVHRKLIHLRTEGHEHLALGLFFGNVKSYFEILICKGGLHVVSIKIEHLPYHRHAAEHPSRPLEVHVTAALRFL